MATRLYATGACATKREASEAAGLHPSYFTMASNPNNPAYNPKVTHLMDEIDAALNDKTIDMASILQMMGREAAKKMLTLMDHDNAAIQFKAAQDLLDRSPDTSKVQKHQVATFSLDNKDAKELTAALIATARMRAGIPDEVIEGDFVQIPIAVSAEDEYAEQVHVVQANASRQGLTGEPHNSEGMDRGPTEGEASKGTATQADAA